MNRETVTRIPAIGRVLILAYCVFFTLLWLVSAVDDFQSGLSVAEWYWVGVGLIATYQMTSVGMGFARNRYFSKAIAALLPFGFSIAVIIDLSQLLPGEPAILFLSVVLFLWLASPAVAIGLFPLFSIE